MKSKLITILIITLLIFSFTSKNEIEECFISFKSSTNLTPATPDRLPEAYRKGRKVTTYKGEVEITCIDGYRVLYNNNKKVPFVNLKVELSERKAYEKDQKHLIENLKYLNSNSSGMESKDLIELEFNGYKIYGLSRGSIESGSTLGTFIMFPGNGVTVYFYFNNLKPEYRNFENVDDYKKQRDRFIKEYTKYLTTCKGK
ncbi:hypothetical protein [Flavobacterium saccharophilum]|uniref:Uncharacterized protein n=1 Tax=Flavobacterium saccharophilum TaxID=29534 RepID=A0A1M7M810_9FLAO|nr:hypothetical protein [Flavobacterium saccharophilum]SHM86874.1 hypothetical protein SAMN05444366_4403 [Flavobacterium saccharophilum]